MINAPVGKSGPLIRAITAASCSSRGASGLSSSHSAAADTSRRLCGGIWVAIPTAIPADPFTSRFGNRAGSTDGSDSLPS